MLYTLLLNFDSFVFPDSTPVCTDRGH